MKISVLSQLANNGAFLVDKALSPENCLVTLNPSKISKQSFLKFSKIKIQKIEHQNRKWGKPNLERPNGYPTI